MKLARVRHIGTTYWRTVGLMVLIGVGLTLGVMGQAMARQSQRLSAGSVLFAAAMVEGNLSCDIPAPNPGPLCDSSGNTLTANVSGGTGPYDYAWTIGNHDPGWAITAAPILRP